MNAAEANPMSTMETGTMTICATAMDVLAPPASEPRAWTDIAAMESRNKISVPFREPLSAAEAESLCGYSAMAPAVPRNVGNGLIGPIIGAMTRQIKSKPIPSLTEGRAVW
jgi:hypothetical protein